MAAARPSAHASTTTRITSCSTWRWTMARPAASHWRRRINAARAHGKRSPACFKPQDLPCRGWMTCPAWPCSIIWRAPMAKTATACRPCCAAKLRRERNFMSEQDHGATMNPQRLAQAAADAMYARDPATQAMGIALTEIRPGYARMTMTIRADMLNGHDTCHGGYIFALADSTFAFACNSHNQNTVASGCTIDYLAPG